MIVRNPSDSKRLTYNKNATKRDALSMTYAKELYNALGQLKMYQDRLLIAIPIFIGTRRGETLALRWENVDWDNGVIHIREAVSFENGRPRLGKPKSESGIRDIPFDSRLEAMLKPIKRDSGFIIGDGEIPITECTYRSAWKRIKRTIDVKKFTAHHYRHTFITFSASACIDVKTLQAICGHADASTTMNHYAHQRKDILHDAGNKMDTVFSEIG